MGGYCNQVTTCGNTLMCSTGEWRVGGGLPLCTCLPYHLLLVLLYWFTYTRYQSSEREDSVLRAECSCLKCVEYNNIKTNIINKYSPSGIEKSKKKILKKIEVKNPVKCHDQNSLSVKTLIAVPLTEHNLSHNAIDRASSCLQRYRQDMIWCNRAFFLQTKDVPD